MSRKRARRAARPKGRAARPTQTKESTTMPDAAALLPDDAPAPPGVDALSLAELSELAGMAGITPPAELEGKILEQEAAEAKQLLDEAEERGEGVLELAHAVAYLDSIHKAIGQQLRRTRARAEQVNAAAQLVHGTKSVAVTLDDGGPAVCTVHIADPEPEIVWDRDAVLAYTRAHSPDNVQQVFSERALLQPEVQAYITMFFPEFVRAEVRPAYLGLLKELLDEQGQLADPATGECHQLATVKPPRRTGAFRLTYARAKAGQPEGKERIQKMFRKGLLGDVLSLGAAPDDDDQVENDQVENAA